MAKPVLGKGLGALIGKPGSKSGKASDVVPSSGEKKSTSMAPLKSIVPSPLQPRQVFEPEQLQELVDSIREHGIIQPLIVRKVSGQLELIAGERRWRAAVELELEEVPVRIVKVKDDRQVLEIALIENLQREDLNPIEEAVALQRLQQEFELTQQEVADAVGKSRSTVTNLLRLMTLQEDVRRLVEHGDLEMGHARALLALEGGDQSHAAAQVVGKGMSVRQTEALVRNLLASKDKPKEPKTVDPNIRHLQDDLAQRLGTKVQIQHSAKGKGKLVLNYNSLDELDGILSHIK